MYLRVPIVSPASLALVSASRFRSRRICQSNISRRVFGGSVVGQMGGGTMTGG
jgi:hypothetical protein